MAKWLLLKESVDHRFADGSVLALKKDTKVYLPENIASELLEKKLASTTAKPAADDPQHVATASVRQTDHPVIDNARIATTGFQGYPNAADRRKAAMSAASELGAMQDRSEDVEETIRTNEQVAKDAAAEAAKA